MFIHMIDLEKLTQDELGKFFHSDGREISFADLIPVGKIRTIVYENFLNISEILEEKAKRYPSFIPYGADSYIVSEFNCDSQHIKKDSKGKEKAYSVFAIQFYHIRRFHVV